MRYLVSINTHGYAEVEAESENDAIEKAAKLNLEDVEWSGAWGTSDCEVLWEAENEKV